MQVNDPNRGSALLLALVPVIAFAVACPTPPTTPPVDDPGEGEGEEGEGEGEGEPEGDAGPPPRPECTAYPYRDETYNCEQLDRCEPQSFQYALACCECDPMYCDPDPNCAPPPDAGPPPVVDEAETCMECHNGSEYDDYTGPGLSNPHPFGVPGNIIKCSACHGGDPTAEGKQESHVPPPPQIGDRTNMVVNPESWFNYLNKAGLDKVPDYTGNGRTYTGLDYINFINPGDLRIVGAGRGCGSCHQNHATQVSRVSPIGTEIGFFSSATYHIGVDNAVVANRGLFQDTASDYTYRGGVNPNYNAAAAANNIGEIRETVPVPEYAQFDGPWYNNPQLTAANLADDQYNSNNFATDDPEDNGKIRTGSDLAKLYQTQISITCGDCHAGSSGANNRYADFRSSGCTACHMEYSMDGRSRSTDPNVDRYEPINPDAIAAPERPHIDSHQVRNVAKILPNGGGFLRGISDRACVGCHQGSNRTVLQYWGIRLDQNADLVNNFQYPANPVTFTNTAQDPRLFDAAVQNNTFNGRNANQYILEEDYDGDTRDDTPEDIHYEAGLGCIDCHGSNDVHSNDGVWGGKIKSKMDQVVTVLCESCHGDIDNYATTTPCTDYLGATKECIADKVGSAMRNTEKDAQGNFWLISRVTGDRHFIPQSKDTVYANNKRSPEDNQLIYNAKASYAMGRVNGANTDGIGPQQTNPQLVDQGFAHQDSMDCMSCHASWANQCIGCHLRTQYDTNPQNYFFSNITGERILQKQQNADFTYISPVMMYLGVNSKNRITQTSAGMKVFYAYIDYQGNTSQVFTFSDRQGNGNNPNYLGRNAHPALGQYQMAAHSVRGKIAGDKEGPRYCVACHNTVDGINNFGADYAAFLATYAARDYANLNFALLQTHIGSNTGNQLNSPFFVHSTAGLGTGLFLFDANGCPVNPLDANANRFFCNGAAPADNFNANNVAYDTDRIVELTGVSNVAQLHPMQVFPARNLRDGSLNPLMQGTLGASIINKLTNTNVAAGGKVLDSWIDADANAQGDAANYIQ